MYEDTRTILPSGLLSQASAPKYTPKPINFGLIGSNVTKPPPDWVNPDKELAEQKALQQQSIDLQKEQFAASQEMNNKQLALSYYQYALAVKNSNKKTGKIICTRFYELGYMDKITYMADQCYGEDLAIRDPFFMQWYQENAPWWVERMHCTTWKSKLFTNILWLFAKPWAEEMAYRFAYDGVTGKGSIVGSFIMNIGYKTYQIMTRYRYYYANR